MTTRVPGSRATRMIAVLVLAAVVAGAIGLWYLFFRPAGPPPVSLASLPPAASAAPATPGEPGAATGIDGTWQVDPTIGSFSDFSGSFAGYRVREELARVGATEAVGRTPDVTGTLTVADTTVTAAEITVDLTTLRSDEANRDRQLSRQALETARFPSARFTLTDPIDIGGVPAQGETLDLALNGELTLHGVTNRVAIPVQARLDGEVVTVAGSLEIVFADYGIERPQAVIVLSVEDRGVMEFQLHFRKS